MKPIVKPASLLTFSSLAAWSLASNDGQGVDLSLAEKEAFIMNSLSAVDISEWSYYYTHGLHLAGTNYSQAAWTRDRWLESGIPSTIIPYNVFLDYPVKQTVSLSYPNGSVFDATVQEDALSVDSTTSYPNRVTTFHGYSFTGKVTAEYVFVG